MSGEPGIPRGDFLAVAGNGERAVLALILSQRFQMDWA